MRTWLVWWLLCGALWMILDDTTARPELIDGAAAAVIGATATTIILAHTSLRFAARAAWARRCWRPWAQLIVDLPMLAGVLLRALASGERDPGTLREVPFAVEPDPDVRAAQVALASFVGTVSPNSVVAAVDEERGTMIVHELVPGRHGGPDPLELAAQ